MRRLALALGLIGVGILPCICQAQGVPVDDPFSDYLQRSDKIFLGAGNAQDVNGDIQTITPWPPHVGDTRIPLSGRQAVNSMERMYRTPDPFQRGQETSGAGPGPAGEAGSVSMGLSPTAPVQPVSGGY